MNKKNYLAVAQKFDEYYNVTHCQLSSISSPAIDLAKVAETVVRPYSLYAWKEYIDSRHGSDEAILDILKWARNDYLVDDPSEHTEFLLYEISSTTNLLPYVKAFVSEIKDYIKKYDNKKLDPEYQRLKSKFEK